MNQLDLFGTAAHAPARRPAKPDTALLLAMSEDHARSPGCAHLDHQGKRAALDTLKDAAE